MRQSINRLFAPRGNEGVKPGETRRDSSRAVSGRGGTQTKLPLSRTPTIRRRINVLAAFLLRALVDLVRALEVRTIFDYDLRHR